MSLPALSGAPAELASAAEYARAESSMGTRRAYESDFRHFVAWCQARDLDPLPASIETAVRYFADLADSGLTVATIDRRAAALAYAHRLAGLNNPCTAEPVRAVLRGIRNTIGSAVKQKAPITAKVLQKLLRKIGDTGLVDLRDRALLSIGFAAALRRSELVALNLSDIEPHPEGVIVHIRKSKTDQSGKGHSVAIPAGSKLRPTLALGAWVSAASLTDGALFRRVRKGGHVGDRLTDQSVALIVKSRAKAAGLDPELFAGHSLRAGFVTSALEAGADVLKVMDVTRHTDVGTLKAYDRRAKAFANHAGKGFL